MAASLAGVVTKTWVMRVDAGTLRPPTETSQGFLRCDGFVGRAGLYKYVNTVQDEIDGLGKAGSIRTELRPEEEVFRADSLAGFEGAPLTLDHPGQRVTLDNVKRFEVGTVIGSGRREGDRVAATMVIKDKKAIAAVKARKSHRLSPGYRMRLDDGEDNAAQAAAYRAKYGAFDFIQRDITINHLALVDHARGGDDMQLRMDKADMTFAFERRDDMDGSCDGDDLVLLTSSTEGHQHTVCLDTDDSAGSTSYATAEGADSGHSHMWIRNTDGSITIAEDSGHDHTVQAVAAQPDPLAAAVAAIGSALDVIATSAENRNDSAASMRQGEITMNPEEQIRSLKAQIAEIEKTAEERAGALAVATDRADKADARVKTLEDLNAELTTKIAAGATFAESQAIKAEAERADKAEAIIAQHDEKFDNAVMKRASIMNRAQRIMGVGFRMDRMSERDIQAVVVKKLRPAEDIGPKVTEAYIAGRFDSLVEAHDKSARSHTSLAEVIANGDQNFRADAADKGGNNETPEMRRNNWRNQARQPIAATARQKGAR